MNKKKTRHNIYQKKEQKKTQKQKYIEKKYIGGVAGEGSGAGEGSEAGEGSGATISKWAAMSPKELIQKVNLINKWRSDTEERRKKDIDSNLDGIYSLSMLFFILIGTMALIQ